MSQIEYKYLTDTPIKTIHQCMQASFADYQLDMSYMTVEVMKHRNALCRNNREFSVGAFSKERMIGFLNVGIDRINNELAAFDGGTGVVKEYRGQGIAGAMFAKSIEALRQNNVGKFILEVLQKNKSAIRAYRKEGFVINRNFKCYDIDTIRIKQYVSEISDIDIKSISVNELEKYWHYIPHRVSWEHELSGLKAVDHDIILIGAFQNNTCVGFAVYLPILCWITALGINPNYADNEALVGYLISNLSKIINPTKPKISMNNLTEEDKLNDIIPRLGFENSADQYEMVSNI